MLLSFTLSMPNVASWNGRWSGEGRLYARVESFRGKASTEKAEQILAKRSFYYDFGDGWGASVSVKQVDAKEAQRIRQASNGFCGYDWMIDSIREHLKIQVPSKRAS